MSTLDKIKRQLPATLPEWVVAIVLLMVVSTVGTVFLAFMKWLWSYILAS